MPETVAAEILYRPATELAGLVRSGEVSARDLVEAALARIEAVEPLLNAFAQVDADGALAAADAIGPGDERPFAGVPIAIKDLYAVQGLRLTYGSDAFGDHTPDFDASVVRRLREAGFVIVGMTTTPEFGILPSTETRRYGPTRNPWDTERSPGGSSGGAAAAVAAGMLPLAQGSDGGGSIRIPAAACGLVGLKPTRGRVSLGPAQGEHLTTVSFGLTRTVADTAALLDVMAGPEPGDAAWAPPPPEPFAATAAREPGKLRIAYTTSPPIDAPVDPLHVAAVHEAAELLETLGHEVEEWTPPWEDEQLLARFTVHFAASTTFDLLIASEVTGREPSAADCEPLSWALYELSTGTFTAMDYYRARHELQNAGRALITEIHSRCDVLLTPSLAERPLPIGTLDGLDEEEPLASFARSAAFTPFTAVANISGQPAISLPLAHGDDGLPIGIQLFGVPADEGRLLALSAQLEATRPWAERRPPL